MSDSEHPSRIHIHLGGLIIIIIILLVLFKVDIQEKIQSPQFQKNITYVEEQIKGVWDKYLKKPLVNSWNGLFNSLIDKSVNQIKKEINLKTPDLNQINEIPDSNNYKDIIN